MGEISRFIKKNRLIFLFFFVSIIVIVSYLLTINSPELFVGAEHWYNLLFQLSIGYVINFIFYITQVYIPNNKRDLIAQKCISVRLDRIIQFMRSGISELAKIYLENHTGNEYTEDELNQLLKLKLSDKVNVGIAELSTRDKIEYFTVRKWLLDCIIKTENEIDSLFKYYARDISVDLMLSLEDILKSHYHATLKILLVGTSEVNLSGVKDFFVDYYRLICQLVKISQKDYK
jgi:hypothetical protein